MLQFLSYNPNDKVVAEINAIEGGRSDLEQRLDDAITLADYCSPFLSSCGGHELMDKVKAFHPIKILDIGFGGGETSLYLASQGHEVHAVEPSPLNCEILHSASIKYGKKIQVYQGTIESFGQIDEKEFDLCLFNSSLHHCDDPVSALKICRNKLKKNGRVIAINEPILKFYRSKKWFFKQLENDPVSVGHYGGNEHIYYYQEYETLFKEAGFASVEGSLHIRNRNPRLVLLEDLQRKIGAEFIHSEWKLLLKFFVLLALKKLWSKQLIALTKKLSLFPYSFEGKMS